MSIAEIPAVLLVGGMGTRLRSVVSSVPKSLASLGKVSFLEVLVEQLRNQGFQRLIMCSGYLADQIEAQFEDGRAWNLTIQYSREQEPLGTAGAIKHARPLLNGASEFVVMNGDSFLDADFGQLLNFHNTHKGIASIAAVWVENTSRYGTLRTASDARVTGFAEKTGIQEPGHVNAGIYVFGQSIFDYIPSGPCSLEREVLPRFIDLGIYALKHEGLFIDIGTPEDYTRAQNLFKLLNAAASRK